MPVWLQTAFIVIIAILAVVALYYQWKLYRARRHTALVLAQQAEAAAARREDVNRSIQLICRALLERQVESPEASIRISGLLDCLGVAGREREEFVAFDKMTESIRHIPRLEGWNALTRSQRRQYQKQLDQHQSELDDFILEAARKMRGRSF